jgi:dTDP-4-dehydrorhamnose reductase
MCFSKTLKRFFFVRTSWLFGYNGRNICTKPFSPGGSAETACGWVNDQFGRADLYALIWQGCLADMADRERYGTYHATK